MSSVDQELAQLRSTVAALAQAVEVLETAALDETGRRDAIMAELARRSAHLRGLAEASLAVNSASSTVEILDVVTAAAVDILGARQATASLAVNRDWGRAVTSVHVADGRAEPRARVIRPETQGLYDLVCERNEVMRLTQAELAAHPAWRGVGDHDPEHPTVRGWLAAPLVAPDGSNIGLVQLSDRESGEFTDHDETVLVQLARVAAIALQNTRAYEREHQIAVTLQRSLLPDHIPSPAGTLIATRYFPGAGGTRVGGDWYDVVPLPHGQVAVVLGDVVGHGLRAAATMGQLRAALRAYAVVDPSPAAVLRRLEHLLVAVGDVVEGYVATLFYAVVDPGSCELHFLSAGHPAPVLVTATGEARLLSGALTAPLGLGGGPRLAHQTAPLPEGSTLLLYTDGLIERRGESLDAGLDRLLGACSGAEPDLERLCDRIVATMTEEHTSDDDVALLALRLTGTSISRSWEFPPVPSSVARARHEVVAMLRRGSRHDLVDLAELAASELVTNAVRHATTALRLDVDLEPVDRVRIAVHDDGPSRLDPDAVTRSERRSGGGRGLFIVDAIAESWGVEHGSDGKTVWCVLDAARALEPAH